MMDPSRRPEAENSSDPPPFTPARALVWMLGSFLTMVLGALIYLGIDPNAGSDLVGLGIVSAASFLLMSAFLISRYPGGARLSEPLGARVSHPLAVVVGLLIGLAAKIPAEQLNHWIEQVLPRSAEETARFAEMFHAQDSLHAAALFLVIAVLVPISEEVFFRGAVYGALRRSKTPELPAALVTALGFTFCHADMRQLLPILLMAFLLGALRTLSGSLLPGIAAHIGFNGLAIVGATYELFPGVQELSLGLRWGASGALVGLLGALGFLVGRHPRARASRQVEMLEARESSLGRAGG